MDWQSLFINMKYIGICGCLLGGFILGIGVLVFYREMMVVGLYMMLASILIALIGEMLA